MANSITIRICVLALAIVCIFLFCCNLGRADDSEVNEYVPYTGKGIENANTGTVDEEGSNSGAGVDPAELVAKAILCFNDKAIYSSCEESYRLTERGDIDVPSEYVDQYCTGPCLSETNLVLDCTENIMENFEFYNKATIQDIRDTIKAGCGSGSERGNFNVTKHVQDETGSGHTIGKQILFGFSLTMAGQALLL